MRRRPRVVFAKAGRGFGVAVSANARQRVPSSSAQSPLVVRRRDDRPVAWTTGSTERPRPGCIDGGRAPLTRRSGGAAATPLGAVARAGMDSSPSPTQTGLRLSSRRVGSGHAAAAAAASGGGWRRAARSSELEIPRLLAAAGGAAGALELALAARDVVVVRVAALARRAGVRLELRLVAARERVAVAQLVELVGRERELDVAAAGRDRVALGRAEATTPKRSNERNEKNKERARAWWRRLRIYKYNI